MKDFKICRGKAKNARDRQPVPREIYGRASPATNHRTFPADTNTFCLSKILGLF